MKLWFPPELRFSSKESDEITRFVIEDYFAARERLRWTSCGTPAGFNISESRARGYVATWNILLTSGIRELKHKLIKYANCVRNRDCPFEDLSTTGNTVGL